jgi:MerR family transcriptional regulator, light-induced transcriptional regulator
MTRRGAPPSTTGGQSLLSIGALSTATGIPPDTIRTWERRYGFPVAERKPSGHRVYPLAMVPRLRRAAQAIARGHRAAEVVPASESALEALLASLPEEAPKAARLRASQAHGDLPELEEVLELIRTFDGEQLKRRLQVDWGRLGPLAFLEQRAAAFLIAVGDAWAGGLLEVRHEHFVSAILGDFLRSVRLPLEDRATGPIVALATLPGELHGLGLQMAALVFALAGWRPLVLGVDTPIPEIAVLARELPIAAVALSCVQPRGRSGAALIRSLRRQLPRQAFLLVGGRGAPWDARLKGVELIRDLSGLDHWLRVLSPA